MNQAFFTAMTGAIQQQNRLNVTANNLANTNTTGFKNKQPGFADLLYRNLTGPEETPIARGSGSRMISATTDFTESTLSPYPGGQNYAITGRGFFALQDGITGEIVYTRAGSFHWASFEENGEQIFYLSDQNSLMVLDQNGQRIVLNGDATDTQPIGIYDFENYDGMLNDGTSYFSPVEKNGPPVAGTGQLMHNVIESSNVDVGTEFSRMVETQRTYSYILKMITTQDEIETTLNGLRG